ncbi:MAG: chromosomal replication initiator protein DnaA [Spirochaetaceae bacterium]|jgi:chromosomal replication initiator protein|nr:chromosomal replication initiator protein DnaA [Spirochaetaceae bacterium]
MAEWNYEIFWKETLNLIQKELSDQEFTMWFTIDYLRATEKEIVVTVPHPFYRDQVSGRYKKYIESKLKELTGKDLSVVFEIKPPDPADRTQAPPEKRVPRESGLAENPRKGLNSAAPGFPEGKKRGSHFQLNKDYTFDKYVIGDNNSFPANAALAIARNPGVSYPVFLIYGGVGLGKTHLMQAIGNYIYENSESKIIYITAENFVNEFIQGIQDNKMPAFKNKYRYVDALLIDDIHFFENKWETQEELFHTFNTLYDAKKQIVFTCDRPVSDLKRITDRLKSRFERGLNVDLQPPNYETRYAILKKKIETKNVPIPDEVIALISKNISSNIRDLEAALTKLIAYGELVGRPITVEIAQQQLKDVFASPKQANMSIEIIQRVVAEEYKLSLTDLKGPKRTQKIVFPRQLAMYITRDITEYSTTDIGDYFGGRDHTTVMHSCKAIEERIRADPWLDSKIENLKRLIKEYNAKS